MDVVDVVIYEFSLILFRRTNQKTPYDVEGSTSSRCFLLNLTGIVQGVDPRM